MNAHDQAEVVINTLNMHNNIQKRIGGALSIHGIGLSEYLVLHHLFNAPRKKMRRTDLAEQVGLTPSGITRLLNPMEKIGLVKKDINPRDARVSLVSLPISGKRVYEETTASFQYASTAVFEALDPKQLAKFSQLIKMVGA